LMSRICPNCASDTIMSKRAIHLSGTTATNSTTAGVGVVRFGGVGAGVASHSGISASALAIDCAPPAPKLVNAGLAAFLIFVLAFIACAYLMDTRALYWAYVAAAVAVVCWLQIKRSNARAIETNAAKVAQYEKEWRCLTCAHTFVPGEA